MRKPLASLAICMLLGLVVTVATAWGLWLTQPRAAKRALEPSEVTAVLEREYGPLEQASAPIGIEKSGLGWRDVFATTLTPVGTRQVRRIEAGWPQPCLMAAERPREPRGFMPLPGATRMRDGEADGRVPWIPLWSGLAFNVAAMSVACAGVLLVAPRLGRATRRPDRQPV